MELRGSGIEVILIEPGPITTKLRVNAIPFFERYIDWQGSPKRAQYESQVINRIYQDSGPDRFELPASAVTAKLIHAVESPRPRARYYVTMPTYFAGYLRRILPTRAMDAILARL
jgi:hypothetical protein